MDAELRPLRRFLIAVAVLALTATSCATTAEDAGEPSTAGSDSPAPAELSIVERADPRPCDPRPDSPAMGVFRGSGDPNSIDEFEQWLGCDVDYVIEFAARDTWQQIASPDYIIEDWQDDPRGIVLSVAMLPIKERASMAAGARGEYDEYFSSFAESIVDGGWADLVIRLGWEFNLTGFNYYTDNPEEFREYWRRIVAAMRSVEGQQFQFIWNPGQNGVDAVPYYPGDDVVDYIGVDVYDATGAPGTYPYPSGCDDDCRLERNITAWEQDFYGGDTGLAYYSKFARSRDKPLMLPEWGLWDRDDGASGGENLYFLRQMHDFIYEPSNNVVLHAYFEWDGDEGDHRLMTTFLNAGDLFRELFVYPSVASDVGASPSGNAVSTN